MRTLKKALSLVLVLAMVLSLGVSAFAVEKASDFSDYGKVTNKEAVAVLTAIGVINGNTDGTFGPDGNFTRAQAATMISYLTLGTTVANALPASATQFNDVPATHWAAKYVQYCANQGIINGYGDGKFGPDDKLTASQWALMLLGALGYKASNEQIGGAGWEIQVTKLAMNAKVASAEELSGTFNRDMAAKMAYNTLKAVEVEYEGGSNININGAQISTGATRKDREDDGGNKLTFMADHFPKLNIQPTESDDFGRPAAKVVYQGKDVGTFAQAPVATFNGPVTEKVMYETLGVTGFANGAKTARFVVMAAQAEDGVSKASSAALTEDNITGIINTYNTDGDESTLSTVKDAAFAGNTIVVRNDKSVMPGTGYGIKTEVFSTDVAGVYTVVFMKEYLGQVTKVTAAKGENARTVTVDSMTYATEDFAVGDTVIYTKAAGKLQSVVAPETLTGIVSKVSGATATVGGSSVNIGNGVAVSVNPKEQSFYTDADGIIMGIKNGAAASAQAILPTDFFSTLEDGKLVYKVEGVLPNGETTTLTLAAQFSKTLFDVYTYTTDSTTGVSTLADMPTTPETTVANAKTLEIASSSEIKTSTRALTIGSTTCYFANDVKFIFADNANKVATVKDGVQAVPASSHLYVTISQVAGAPAYVTAVYVMAPQSAGVTTSSDIIYVAKEGSEFKMLVGNNSVTYYNYTAYVNGEEVENFYATTSGVTAGFYKSAVNDNGAYVLAGNAYSATSGANAVVTDTVTAYAANTITVASNFYDVSGATIVDLTTAQDGIVANSVKAAVIYNADTMAASYVYVVTT